MAQVTSFEIIAGTYEEYIVGYIFSSEKKTLQQSFASHDHSASIRCLATSGNYLASGASDDRIIIYDLKARREHCMLTHHESTITAIEFTNNHSHVISASQDGALAIIRVGNWQLEKLWQKAHKEGTVVDIALHSSGKLALTLGSDGTIHTWNLVKGREAYIINLKTKCKDPKSLERIIFAPDDTRFLIFGGKYTEIWSIKVGGTVKVLEHDEKVTCCIWLDNDTLLAGYEDGNLSTICLLSEEKTIKLGHKGRVKAAECYQNYIVTASSTGEVKVWDDKLIELCKVTTGCRITCLKITKWLASTIKEEPKDDTTVKEAPANKPLKSTVVVEFEGSSDDEMASPVRKKKRVQERQVKTHAVGLKDIRKCKSKKDSNQNIEKTKRNKSKDKNKNPVSEKNVNSDKKIKKKSLINESSAHSSNLKIKKKKKSKVVSQ